MDDGVEWPTEQEWRAALAALAAAETVAFGGVGFANITSPATEAYWLLRSMGAPARAGIDWVRRGGSIAGRVLATHLLTEIDGAAGREAWEAFATQAGTVSTMGGCVMNEPTLAEYARGELAKLA